MTEQHPHLSPEGHRDDASHGAGMILREEQARVGTERVVSGRVVVRKRIVEEEQTFTVTVRREELEVLEEGAPDVAAAQRSDDGGFEALDHDVTGHDATDRDITGRDAARHDVAGEDAGDAERVIVLYTERPIVTMERVPLERVTVRTVTVADSVSVSTHLAREVATVESDPLDHP